MKRSELKGLAAVSLLAWAMFTLGAFLSAEFLTFQKEISGVNVRLAGTPLQVLWWGLSAGLVVAALCFGFGLIGLLVQNALKQAAPTLEEKT